MPVAAVPKYLGTSFEDASPAMRFGLLLPIWTTRKDQEEEVQKRATARSQEGRKLAAALKECGKDAVIKDLVAKRLLPGLWDKNDFGARESWATIKKLTPADKARMEALLARQKALAVMAAPILQLEAVAVSPFTTGLGNEHPLENGFAFLNPYGLPYLPGSGVKGVLRQAARELASGVWGDTRGWSAEPKYEVILEEASSPETPEEDDENSDKRRLMLSALDVLFGRETEEGEKDHFRGVLCFWDVIPRIPRDEPLLVEIMTPHQSHYYQQKAAQQSTTPHDSGQPTPICFLTVPPASTFLFHVTCDMLRLQRCAPELAADSRWEKLVIAAFEHAFQWLGFGAKTAVGYGAMKRQQVQMSDEVKRAAPSEPTPQPVTAGGQPPAIPPDVEIWPQADLLFNPGRRSVMATYANQRSAELSGTGLEELLAQLGEHLAERLRRERKLTAVRVLVRRLGNKVELVGLVQS